MADITDGEIVLARDIPPAVMAQDNTILLQLTNTTYATGTPEVGTTFVAPTSGRVVIVVGGGARDNGTGDRVFLSPQVFIGTDASLDEVLAPTVFRGFGSDDGTTEFMYASRSSLLTGLTPGQVYYARAVHLTTPGTDPDTADINSREIIVSPVP